MAVNGPLSKLDDLLRDLKELSQFIEDKNIYQALAGTRSTELEKIADILHDDLKAIIKSYDLFTQAQVPDKDKALDATIQNIIKFHNKINASKLKLDEILYNSAYEEIVKQAIDPKTEKSKMGVINLTNCFRKLARPTFFLNDPEIMENPIIKAAFEKRNEKMAYQLKESFAEFIETETSFAETLIKIQDLNSKLDLSNQLNQMGMPFTSALCDLCESIANDARYLATFMAQVPNDMTLLQTDETREFFRNYFIKLGQAADLVILSNPELTGPASGSPQMQEIKRKLQEEKCFNLQALLITPAQRAVRIADLFKGMVENAPTNSKELFILMHQNKELREHLANINEKEPTRKIDTNKTEDLIEMIKINLQNSIPIELSSKQIRKITDSLRKEKYQKLASFDLELNDQTNLKSLTDNLVLAQQIGLQVNIVKAESVFISDLESNKREKESGWVGFERKEHPAKSPLKSPIGGKRTPSSASRSSLPPSYPPPPAPGSRAEDKPLPDDGVPPLLPDTPAPMPEYKPRTNLRKREARKLDIQHESGSSEPSAQLEAILARRKQISENKQAGKGGPTSRGRPLPPPPESLNQPSRRPPVRARAGGKPPPPAVIGPPPRPTGRPPISGQPVPNPRTEQSSASGWKSAEPSDNLKKKDDQLIGKKSKKTPPSQ